jgi:SAM-dependent methyltransferase
MVAMRAGENLSSFATLFVQGSSLVSAGGIGSRVAGRALADPSLLTILEIFCFEKDKREAFKAYQRAASPKYLGAALGLLEDLEREEGMTWAQSVWNVSENSLTGRVPGELDARELNLGASSQATHQILRAVQRRLNPESSDAFSRNLEAFQRGVEVLVQSGLLVPASGHVRWGQLRRLEPVGKNFGYGRGTPIDRYYLGKFIELIRPLVQGNTLEIGGSISNGVSFGFTRATEYHAVELHPSPNNDYAGDVHEASLIAADVFDAIVCFNVLEHCTRPWIVVDNMHKWLKKGGKAFCMVPNAQRVHEMPRDYWRPLPSAMESMFSAFSHIQLHVYGNLITHTASFYGIACEELKPEELDYAHPDYPVATCIVAEK